MGHRSSVLANVVRIASPASLVPRRSGGMLVPVLALLFAALLLPAPVSAQSAVTPYFMVIVDNSGSMDASTGSGNNSCGRPRNRINDAKCVLQRVVNGYGDVTFGLERFATTTSGTCSTSCGTDCGCDNSYLDCDGCRDSGSGCPSSGGTAAQGQVLVPIQADNQSSILRWIDYTCSTCSRTGTNPELEAATWTPLAGSLRAARRYFLGNDPTFTTSPLAGDPFGTCRPVYVILLTDGDETCSANADTNTAATELRTTTVGGTTYDIRTYVIGFGISAGNANIEAIATAGGTDAPGTNRGFYASDETSLALAFSQIIQDSIRFETCDGADNDCDTRIDEGFTLYCNRPGGVSTARLCTDPGETVCNGTDDNCNGQTDEGLLNRCGTCGATPAEVCNGGDDDCDGVIDESACTCTSPSPEICDGLDNDCDTRVDEGPITRPCGTDVGECSAGTQTCIAGVWSMCSGSTGPGVEACNNRDDDCDGSVDGFVEACGSMIGACRPGSRLCTAGSYGSCVGGIGPQMEICNTADDDCDTRTDEGNPGGGGMCGSTVGECRGGTLQCMAGMLTCVGGVGPMMEVCDNGDDDCDGRVDEGNPGGGAACGMTDVGECELGTRRCVGGTLTCVGERGPRMELCNALDDDCDGRTDEGNPEGGQPCGDDTGECRSGTTVCSSGMLTCNGAIGPTTEVCNDLDDDCDGAVDDEIPVGAPCGSDVGECLPGINVCEDGMLVCSGEVGPTTETCNLLDDDCDTRVDEGLADGAPCGMDEGVCMPGVLRCVEGLEVCVGGVPGGPETCDCEDNDCDGMTDEPPPGGSLCPPGSECVQCQCASECVRSEFGFQCPTGRVPLVDGSRCICVEEACDEDECGAQTINDDTGTPLCAPGSDDVGACICRSNECTFACDGVTCPAGLVCDPRDPMGRCVEDDCRGLGCSGDQICDRATGMCVDHPCNGVTCADGQACRAGVCEPSCAGVDCPAGQLCRSGVCTEDRCDDVSCETGEVCDPATGACVTDACEDVACPGGTECEPTTGECLADPCELLRCADDEICVDGECEDRPDMPDAGVSGMDAGVGIDAGRPDEEVRVVAAGGGGAMCATSGAGGRGEPSALFALLAVAVALSMRRARKGGAR